MRRELRRTCGCARVGRGPPGRWVPGTSPDARPLRGRRASDLGVRDPHVLARGPGPDGFPPPDLPRTGGDNPVRNRALATAVDLLDLRLPGPLHAPLRAERL